MFRVLLATLYVPVMVLAAEPKTLAVAGDGSGDFKTVQEAVDAVQENNKERVVIRIKPGTYKQIVRVPKGKPFVTFRGDDGAAAKTILTFDNHAKTPGPDGRQLGTSRSASTFIEGTDFVAENVTFANTAGEVGQALAISVKGDRQTFRNCRFIGWQDTLLTDKGRQYYVDCHIEGRVDFIFGEATCLFERCTIKSKNGGYVTAASTPQDVAFGYVFLDCKLTSDDATPTYLGRPWRPYASVAYINCEMGPHVRPEGWNNWGKAENERTARYAEYKSRGPGANPKKRVPWSNQLTADEAKSYTVAKVLGGKDGWNPAGESKPKPAITKKAEVGEELKYPWVADQGDGTYRNPILCADYSDPDVVRVGEDFWMTASSFTDTPGLPILHSKDLVNWTLVNHAFQSLPDPRYKDFHAGHGVWAPAIRHHDGKFWIFFPTPDEGIYVTTATDPTGKWSEPAMLLAGKGLIDPCPLWDDDGKAYLVHAYARSRSGIKHRLRVVEMSQDGTKVLGEGKTVFEDPERHPTLEGPKFLKRDGWYYILAPAGGVASGWQTVLRSKDVNGPYEDKIVLEQGSTPINGPHQGALVDTPDGKEWWFVHFQERQPYGRITHLQPVTWKDNWPLMGVDADGNGVGEPVLRHRKPAVGATSAVATPATSDEFDADKLGLQWQWHANHDEAWSSQTARRGCLRLFAVSPRDNDLAKSPNLLLQKLPSTSFACETLVEGHGAARAGLAVIGKKHAALAIEGNRLVFRIDNQETASVELKSKSARLRCTMKTGGECTFAFAPAEGGEFQTIGASFQAIEGTWIGAKVGLFAVGESGHADFDYFRFE